jgi:hypothetical protein
MSDSAARPVSAVGRWSGGKGSPTRPGHQAGKLNAYEWGYERAESGGAVRMMRARLLLRWTPEQCRALYAARQRGVTLRALAQAYGVSTESIRYLAAKGQRLEMTTPPGKAPGGALLCSAPRERHQPWRARRASAIPSRPAAAPSGAHCSSNAPTEPCLDARALRLGT